MAAVADIFDRDGDGYIDYKEFVGALRPERADVSEHSPIKMFWQSYYSLGYYLKFK